MAYWLSVIHWGDIWRSGRTKYGYRIPAEFESHPRQQQTYSGERGAWAQYKFLGYLRVVSFCPFPFVKERNGCS